MTAPLLLPEEYDSCVVVMGGWIAIYYVYMWLCASVNMSEDFSENHKLWGNRIFLNMGEQAPAFLVSFWLHALTVSPDSAATIGTYYLLFTVSYAVVRLMLQGKAEIPLVISTNPRYAMVMFYTTTAVLKRGFDVDYVGLFGGSTLIAYLTFVPIAFVSFLVIEAFNRAVIAPRFKDSAPKKKD